MWQFIRRQLDPSTRFGEALFGLIMALGITGAVSLGLETANNHEVFVAILGCNLAWGVVDGVMYVMVALIDRGRKSRLVDGVLNATSEDEAIQRIAAEIDDRLRPLATNAERIRLYHVILKLARRMDRSPPRLHREDILGGLAVTLIVVLITLPILVPYLLISNTMVAVRLSNVIACGLQFWLGYAWGRNVGFNPLITGIGVMSIGVVLVFITIALGG